MVKVPIGQLLLHYGYVTEEQLNVAMGIKTVRKKLLGEILVEQSFVSPREIALVISRQARKPYIDISEYPASETALKILNRNIAKQLEVLPLSLTSTTFTVAMANPFDINAIDILKRRSNKEVEILVSDKETILKRAEVLYYMLERPINVEIMSQIETIRSTGQPRDIPQFVDNVLNYAIIERCTDVHLSPEENDTHVFYRIDGVMRHYFACPKIAHPGIVSRIKILSDLDISETRIPQDGALSHSFFDETFDVRVSSLPTNSGENIVLRILSKNLSLFSLEGLGFEEEMRKKVVSQFQRTQGIVLVTGPTGSGKTTSLYAGLRKINSLQRRVLTAEDPIEYRFPFIKQTQINNKAGYTFSSAMRAFLRQDPDVILLGEMRDEQTAETAISAAITGHLVLSTMHTNDAITTIPRLMDLKIKDHFIAAALSAVIAQRLIRKVCNFCREDKEVTGAYMKKLGFLDESLEMFNITDETKLVFPYGKGCSHCRNTGYSGRTVINEVFLMTPEIGDMVIRGETPLALLKKARENGMVSMMEDGIHKCINKLTNPEEIRRVLT